MVVLRRTNKLAHALPASAEDVADSDTALGDWYVNRLVVDRRPLLLLVSSRGLLPMVTPARDVSALPSRLIDDVAARLLRLAVPQHLIDAETRAMRLVRISKTIDRSVVGILVDFAKTRPFYLAPGVWDERTLPFLEARLAETPCHAGTRDVVFPYRDAVALLHTRWE